MHTVGPAHATRGLITVGLFAELQKRIPDRWFFRRLLPATVFVVVAVVGGGQLGQSHWDDIGLARDRISDALRLGGGAAPDAAASLTLLAIAVTVCTLTVPFAATAVDTLTSGAWPWWLTPLGERVQALRARRWAEPAEIGRDAVLARAQGKSYRAARLEARKARTTPAKPVSFTWSGDRFAAARSLVNERTGLDIETEWTRLLLVAPDTARTALTGAREAYDAACEAIVWSIAVSALGAWWWPGLPIGLAIYLAAWRWLRRAVGALSETTEAAFVLYAAALAQASDATRPDQNETAIHSTNTR
jgi:hypothetical protein